MRNRRKKADWRAINKSFLLLHRVRERLFARIGKAVLFWVRRGVFRKNESIAVISCETVRFVLK